MKIVKLQKDEIDENLVYVVTEFGDKTNEIIEAMTCPECDNIKGMVGKGLCFSCDQKKQKRL